MSEKEEITRIESYIMERFRRRMEDIDLSTRILMAGQAMCIAGV